MAIIWCSGVARYIVWPSCGVVAWPGKFCGHRYNTAVCSQVCGQHSGLVKDMPVK